MKWNIDGHSAFTLVVCVSQVYNNLIHGSVLTTRGVMLVLLDLLSFGNDAIIVKNE